MSRRFSSFSSLLVLTALLLYGCDPMADALKAFTQQGLTVLKPARDYIALGGIFVIPKQGMPAYLDPYDSLPGTNGGATSFRAIVLNQSAGNSFALDAGVGTLGGLVEIPAGLKFSHSKQVQLAQIDASGTRYTSQMVAALIRMPATTAAIQGQLNSGNRVFVVQELYIGKSLSLKSSDGTGLAAAVEGNPSPENCSKTTDGSQTPAASAPPPTSDSTAPGTGKTEGAAKPATAPQATSKPSTTGGTGKTAAGAAAQGTSNVGVSVGVCWSNAATLSFQSTNAIPFAVRLNEVGVGPDNVLQVKITGFKLPNTALGDEGVSATALINPNDPAVSDVVHKDHNGHTVP